MPKELLRAHWLALFPRLNALDPPHRQAALHGVVFKRLEDGSMAYHQDAPCTSYVMCLEGRTRTYKTSATGREILLYRVTPGETCVLTTSCLLARRGFPAESAVEAPTLLATLPAPLFHELMAASPAFRGLVLDNYGAMMASLITHVDEVAFSSLDLRLARKLVAEADAAGIIASTHQQIAQDLGSVREVVSRYLREWERAGWIRSARGSIEVLDRAALDRYGRQS